MRGKFICFITLCLSIFYSNLSAQVNLDKFDYVVVLMMENRSFDNMLGYLYENGVPPGQSFNGVSGKNLSNPIPPYADSSEFVDSVYVHKEYVMTNPNPDPGEEFPHINTQMFGTVIPDTNRFLPVGNMFPPYNEPFPIPNVYPLNGHVLDYVNTFRRGAGRFPEYYEYKIIMGCFPPDAVPVISTLAKGFAVCDNWYCGVPSQTFCNRSFFDAASSWGYVNNAPYQKWTVNFATTIYDRFQDAGVSWRIYFDPIDIIPLSLFIHFPRLVKYTTTNFAYYDRFKKDVKDGTLPKYSFIEPRLFVKHNDEHPPDSLFSNIFTPSNVLAGEILINDVYTAIKNSNSATGNNWKNTLLVITYDEHGGTYDHVQPPPAIPPYVNAPAGEMDFTFNRSGRRVPAVFVSAYIDSNTIYNDTLRHTSMIKTMCEKYSMPHITLRDLSAPNFLGVFNRGSIRDVSTWPTPKPRALPHDGDKDFYLNFPLTDFQEDIIGVAAALEKMDIPLGIETTRDAIEYLKGFKQRMKIKFMGDL